MTDGVGFFLDQLEAAPAPRNATKATAEPFHQWKLREQVRALKEAYGWRPEPAPNHKAMPYVPAPFAEDMLRYFRVQARHWLGKSIPDGAKMPGYIKRHRDEATRILGTVVSGQLVPDAASYETAPAQVASKAPSYYNDSIPAGRPHPLVLTAEATHRFLYALSALAIHFDALDGTPTKLDIFIESVEESVKELPDTLAKVVKVPYEAGKGILGTLMWVGVGLAALILVTRK